MEVMCGRTARSREPGPWPPMLVARTPPKVGTSFLLDVLTMRLNSPAVMILGVKKISVSLTPAGALGCTLLTDPVVLIGLTTSATGSLSFPLAIPSNSKLVGLKFYSQFAVTYPAANPMQLVFTNGVEATIGY